MKILVKNSGSAFEDNLLELLDTQQKTPNRSGLVFKVNKRIKLLFGDAYGLSLYNEGEFAVANHYFSISHGGICIMLKLVIADDERIIRETISTIIDWKQYDIELVGLCKNGLEAYDMILDESPDIVLTDIRMPGMDGLELIQRISQTDLNTQFIILSGYGEFEYAKTSNEIRRAPLPAQALQRGSDSGKYSGYCPGLLFKNQF